MYGWSGLVVSEVLLDSFGTRSDVSSDVSLDASDASSGTNDVNDCVLCGWFGGCSERLGVAIGSSLSSSGRNKISRLH